MNNMLGLIPLLGIATALSSALLLIAITLGALLLTSVVAWGVRNAIPESMRLLVVMALVAGAIGCSEAFALAFAYDSTQSLEFLLPLVASNILLFAHIDTILRGRFASITMMTRATLSVMGVTAATWSIVGTVAQFIAADNALPLVFVAAALLIALHNRWLRREPPPITPTPRKRQRVTGPVR